MLIELPMPSLIIQTRAGNNIPNESGFPITPEDVLRARNWQRGEYPEGLLLWVRKEPNGVYNCHGLTFLSRRAFLLDELAVKLILADDEYYEVGLEQVQTGDVILYYDRGELQHSGLVVFIPEDEAVKTPWVLSKWGHAGEYLHRYHYCL
jgi:hypothetical protein